MPIDDHRRINRDNWDSRVGIHVGSDEYRLARFIEDPGHLSDVVSFDRHRFGDIEGARVLHLQCHIGTDTISLARLGAEVTGTDFSPQAIEAARRLSDQSGTAARFVEAELYDTPDVLTETFDLVYTGVGAICWLPDIAGWARVVAGYLEPGGRFYMREGHPLLWALDWDDPEGKLSIVYSYFEDEPNEFEEDTTYAGEGTLSSPKTFDWNHGIAEVLTALMSAGLRIDAVEEHEFCEWQAMEDMELGEDDRWRLAAGRPRIPLMWSVLATKT